MKKFIFSVILFISINLFAQTTLIPDSNFEQALIDLGIDSDQTLNGYVLTSDINSVENLDISAKNISDLCGISDFTHLNFLDCSNNLLNNIDLTNLSELTELYCYNNLLQNIFINGCTNLIFVECGSNDLTSLDFTSNYRIEYLSCGTNNLTQIPTYQLPNLKYIDFTHNWVNEIDISLCPLLEYFISDSFSNNGPGLEMNNIMETLDFTNNPNLIFVSCIGNGINQIIFGFQPNLSILDARENDLTNIDLSQTPNIKYLLLSDNNLISIDLSNLILLKNLYLYKNLLSHVDVSYNSLLEYLFLGEEPFNYFETNHLLSLNVSNNPNLKLVSAPYAFFHPESNPEIHLDFSQTPMLNYLDLGVNKIQSLNIANGNNENLTLKIGGTTTLRCVKVDNQEIADIANADLNSWQENDITIYNTTSCPTASVENYSDKICVYPNPVEDLFKIDLGSMEIDFIEIYDSTGKFIFKNYNKEISMSKYESGIYFIKIFDKVGKIYLSEMIKK